MEGWIKLHRSMLEWEWIGNPNVVALFVHCLLKANWQDKKWQGKTIERGSFVTSISSLADDVGLSVQQTRTSLSKLIKSGELATKSQQGQKYTIITVCKYSEYQEQQRDNNEITNKQQRDNKEITTTKEYKEYKNIKNNISPHNSNYIYNAREDEDDIEDFKVAKKVRLSVIQPEKPNYSERTRQHIEEYRRSNA